MGPLWQAVLRFAAEWVVLILIGGALGVGTAEAMQAGWVSERTVAVVYGTLVAGVAGFMLWAARDLDLIGWDDWDDIDGTADGGTADGGADGGGADGDDKPPA